MKRALERRSPLSRYMVQTTCVLLLLWVPSAARSQQEDAVSLTPAEVKARWQGRLNGRHFAAEVTMVTQVPGMTEERDLSVFRDDEGDASERLMIRFRSPPELRGAAILYLEQADRPNDYFLYQPATRRVRRLPSSIADDDIYGIDLEFLGFGVAQTEPTILEEMRTEELNGRRVYLLTESAREKNHRFARRLTWIDAENFVPLRTEHYLEERLVLVAETRKMREVQGVLTPLELYFEKPTDKTSIVLTIDSIDYEQPIPENVFAILSLIKKR